MIAIAESTGGDTDIIAKVVSSATTLLSASLNVDFVVVLDDLKADFNIFQLQILSFFEKTVTFTTEEQVSFFTGLASFDYTLLDVTAGFGSYFAKISFGTSIKSKVLEITEGWYIFTSTFF
jgi:hypothetical protein